MSIDIAWEAPRRTLVGTRTHSAYYSDFSAELKAKPGEWAVIDAGDRSDNGKYSLAGNIKKGLQLAFQPAGSFEAVSRKVDGEIRVYARYVGQE